MATFVKQLSTATSGTVTASPNTGQDIVLIHDAASLAVTLTITLPANPSDGQQMTVASRLGVTTLTISSALTIIGALTTLIAGGFYTFLYEASNNKWYRVA